MDKRFLDKAGLKNLIDNIKNLLDQYMTSKVDKVDGKSLIDDTEINRLKYVDNYDDTGIVRKLQRLEEDGVKVSGDTLPIGSIVELAENEVVPTGWEEVNPINTAISVDDSVQSEVKLKTTRDSLGNTVKVQMQDANGKIILVETLASQIYTNEGVSLDTLLNDSIFILEESNGITHCGDYERYIDFNKSK